MQDENGSLIADILVLFRLVPLPRRSLVLALHRFSFPVNNKNLDFFFKCGSTGMIH